MQNRPKPKLSIQEIGLTQFLVGIVLGLAYAIILTLSFSYASELLRYATTLKYGLITFTDSDIWVQKFSLALAAASLGFSISISFWLGSPLMMRRYGYQKILRNVNYILFLFWLIVVVFGDIYKLQFVSYEIAGYEPEFFGYFKHLWFFFSVIAISLFILCWGRIQYQFKLGYWVPISGSICVAIAMILTNTASIDSSALNNAYQANFEAENSIIEDELNRAKELYNVTFTEQDIVAIYQWRGNEAFAQMQRIQNQFALEKPVEMSDIIIQKILFQIGKEGVNIRGFDWAHAYPSDIYRQLSLFDPGDPEFHELFITIQNLLFVAKRHFEQDYYLACMVSDYSKRSYHLRTNNYFSLNIEMLYEIRRKLIENPNLIEYQHLLPELRIEHGHE